MNTPLPRKPGNSIMQLVERYRQDPRGDKLNLAVGIYTDEQGRCPILDSVRAAEQHRLAHQSTKASFNLSGPPEFHQAVRSLLFPALAAQDAAALQVVQTLGASGALHLAGHLINKRSPGARIWLSAPTWENHPALLAGHRGGFGYYRYGAATPQQFDLNGALEDLDEAEPGDVVLLHVCCHNPTGIDPQPAQWATLAEFCAERQLLPLFDFAYQGFARSLEDDCAPLALFMDKVETMLVCNSFSKNMGIYDERAGALTLMCRDAAQLARWTDDVRALVRASYSLPPQHGAYIVSHIINEPMRFAAWRAEVALMRDDLATRRQSLFAALDDVGVQDAVLSYQRQQGMFLCLDLAEDQIGRLRAEHGIYLLDSGRVSVASLPTAAMPRFAGALAGIVHQERRRA